MKKRSISRQAVVASIALVTSVMANSAAMAQMDRGPKTEKTYGIGLPRDHASQLFSDTDFPVFPLKPGQEAYKDIDGDGPKNGNYAPSFHIINHVIYHTSLDPPTLFRPKA